MDFKNQPILEKLIENYEEQIRRQKNLIRILSESNKGENNIRYSDIDNDTDDELDYYSCESDEEDESEKYDISVYYNKDINTKVSHSINFTDDENALNYATENLYQYICKLPLGKYYFGYRKTQKSRKTPMEIKRNLNDSKTKRTVWIIDYH